MTDYPKTIDGKYSVGNLADEFLFHLTEGLPKELEVIESYYTDGKPEDGGGAFARVCFGGRVFRVTIEPEGREGPDRD